MRPGDEIRIDYLRPPDRTQVFRQRLVAVDAGCHVTFAEGVALPRPVTVGGRPVLEPGADAVWFTFPDVWHDIGRFHLRDGTFTGIYANVITPVEGIGTPEWRTTDLFLDVWIDPGGSEAAVLDEDELDEAVAAGWVDDLTAARVREEADALVAAAARGAWPPEVVRRWTRERCAAALGGMGG